MSVLVVCAVMTAHVRSGAEDPSSGVSVGAAFVSAEAQKEAVSNCHANAPELALGACIDRFYVPRWLLDAEAKARNLARAAPILDQRKQILARRLLETIAEGAPEPTPAQVDAYLKQHERDFKKPLRLRLFRILVSTEEKAKEVAAQLRTTTTLADFRELSRAHSIDKATSERGGDLGFVWPDGSTDVPEVSADPALYQAALPLSDGEFSPAPVPEGKHFAIFWRRGSLPAQEMDDEARSLARRRLQEGAAEKNSVSLLSTLSQTVRGRNDELLGKLRRPEATLFKEL